MADAPVAADEVRRVQALLGYGVLDTPPEPVFDNIVRLASRICDTPIGLISLVDEKRQWFKARVGLDVPETPRECAFCAHAILSDELFIVPDAQLDPRFNDNPLVVGDPHIRFYAGAPLVSRDGFRLGTLCVIDHKPRQLNSRQLAQLQALRDAVLAEFEMRVAPPDQAAGMQLICAWCQKVKGEDASWQQPSALPAGQMVSHGICPSCLQAHLTQH